MMLTSGESGLGFLNRGLAFNHLAQAVLLQVFHTILDRFLLERVQIGVFSNQVADAVGDDEQLKDPGAPVVAGAATVGADGGFAVVPACFLGRLGRLVEVADLVRREVKFA